jgi:hypothetical protein
MFGCLLSWVSFKRLFIDSRGKKRYPSNKVSKMAKIGVHSKNPRINITFEEATAGLLAYLAAQEHKSVPNLAKELIMEALERREDMVLSALAEVRERQGGKRMKHEDVWK